MSIIFNRYQEKAITKIRPEKYINPKTTNVVLGYDSSSQYLGATGSPMPVGAAIVYEDEHGMVTKQFQSPNTDIKEYQSKSAIEYIGYLTHVEGLDIQHARRIGEKQIGPAKLRVDIFNRDNKEIIEFQGCFFHACNCQKGIMNSALWAEKRERTNRKAEYIRRFAKDSKFTQIWECEWQQIKNSNPKIKEFLKENLPSEWSPVFDFEQKSGKGFSIEIVSEKVMNEQLFGMVECDIYVPDA